MCYNASLCTHCLLFSFATSSEHGNPIHCQLQRIQHVLGWDDCRHNRSMRRFPISSPCISNSWFRRQFSSMVRSFVRVIPKPKCSEGLYLNLFIFAIYTLARRRTAGKHVLLVFSWAMAVLGTTQMILRLITVAMTFHFLLELVEQGTNTGPPSSSKLWRTYNSLYIAQEALFAINK
jgi:hypothetical protein